VPQHFSVAQGLELGEGGCDDGGAVVVDSDVKDDVGEKDCS
jgi:hypothetical protein